ncbi:MAG: hypothetical protein A2381_17025 [Bdellovibrionales bacterium RIFOXYB1_FULL_37_110]|nr:MAG: hypothetical protein A2181_08030 [Bdellovibrionales bacterium RIFOXYA1_FULL_38_20]OFZ50100.1 MAG: hypothetical protein A2417_18860 [Bdellovibrionales bacterium RIFOXYC1_FULL_37_79]OFZ60006.1 MAG: hypothetical protein A2381_17025 [Bdellovibrionales bacterium RIFOXYB1_FULL_37_110]OFZ64271.1 MAG: hypothetical protein A2577_12630 [Bdellovibrionales bacterium RIFOXYD1_FULL_36_51]
MDIITNLIHEASHYTSFDQIEKLLEEGPDLSNLPIQPLYALTTNMSNDALALCLPSFSKEQRQAFLDIDLWDKAELDIDHFSRWLKIYGMCKDDEIIYEFVSSEEFLLFLKGRFNVSTFDVEEPVYPDNDNYFLTDDNLLLFEFDEDNEIVSEVQYLIRQLYGKEGVEQAYTKLFKVVSDTFSVFQEEEYRIKKGRLADYGLVDYYDSLALYAPFASMSHMEHFIKNIQISTGHLETFSKIQTLHQSCLVAYREIEDDLLMELSKVTTEKRREFLQFNFLKLVNGSLSFNDALKAGVVAMTRVGKETRSFIELGFDYVRLNRNHSMDESLFEYFNFIDLFKIGLTLTKDLQKEIKTALRVKGFDNENDGFLGDYWNNYLNQTLDGNITILKKSKSGLLNKYQDFKIIREKSKTLIMLLPYIKEFYKNFKILKDENRLMDAYYYNYKVEDIDFEAIIVSSFANYMLGLKSTDDHPKLGLSLPEFKKWAKLISNSEGGLDKTKPALKEHILKFQKEYGLWQVYRFNSYFEEILANHMDGYDFLKLNDFDYKFIGGAIIFS